MVIKRSAASHGSRCIHTNNQADGEMCIVSVCVYIYNIYLLLVLGEIRHISSYSIVLHPPALLLDVCTAVVDLLPGSGDPGAAVDDVQTVR